MKHAHAAYLEDWKLALSGDKLPLDLRFRKTPRFGPIQPKGAKATILIRAEYQDWKKAPQNLRRYVIDENEFWDLVRR